MLNLEFEEFDEFFAFLADLAEALGSPGALEDAFPATFFVVRVSSRLAAVLEVVGVQERNEILDRIQMDVVLQNA